MVNTLHHAPAECPVCGHNLIVTRKGCLSCGTELVGEFDSCEFCVLDAAEIDLLKVFLVSRGNLREVEKHLGVSYPTARLRFAAVVEKLGLTESASASQSDPESKDSPDSTRDQILEQVAQGKISVADATALLSR